MHELQMIWQEVVVAYFNVLSRNLPGGTEENNTLSQDSLSPGRDLNAGPPENEAGMPTTRP
jgi:hypothetical protein